MEGPSAPRPGSPADIARVQNPYMARMRWAGAGFLLLMAGILVASYFLPVGLQPSLRAMIDRAEYDLRLLGEALEAYRADHGAYPAMLPFPAIAGAAADLDALAAAGGSRLHGPHPGALDGQPGPAGILRPRPYIGRLHSDVFAPLSGLTPAYATDGRRWVLFSPGPNRVYDLDPDALLAADRALDMRARLAYDPTNGAQSRGDLILLGPAGGEEGGGA